MSARLSTRSLKVGIVCIAASWFLVVIFLLHSRASLPASVQDPSTRVPPVLTTKPPTIAFATTITSCKYNYLRDGAAVLEYSIRRASVHGHLGGRYDYAMFAFYHPSAEECVVQLKEFGYTLLRREVLVNVSDIEGDYLREGIEKNGCCGEKELLKLESFTLTKYPIVVHFDLDCMVLKPMDELFDLMLHGTRPSHDALAWKNQTMPPTVNALFTFDYNMITVNLKFQHPRDMKKPVQGGFLVVRPNLTVYEEFRAIFRKGDFRDGTGWGGTGVGPFYGAMTMQGVASYYYTQIRPGEHVELSKCLYNQMAGGPRSEATDPSPGLCLTGEDECEDCRLRPIEDVVTAHFTFCSKPWHCDRYINEKPPMAYMCRNLTHEWFKLRFEMEESSRRVSRKNQSSMDMPSEPFYGFCSQDVSKIFRYKPVPLRFGSQV